LDNITVNQSTNRSLKNGGSGVEFYFDRSGNGQSTVFEGCRWSMVLERGFEVNEGRRHKRWKFYEIIFSKPPC